MSNRELGLIDILGEWMLCTRRGRCDLSVGIQHRTVKMVVMKVRWKLGEASGTP